MKTIPLSFLVVAALVFLSSIAFSQQRPAQPGQVGTTPEPLGQVRPMTVAIAEQLVAAAIKSSCSPPAGDCSGAFCVVDDAGTLLYLEAIEGVLSGGPKLCIAKAETPAIWRRPTTAFSEAVKNKTDSSFDILGANPYMTTSPGGVPIFKDGRVVGGFGQAGIGGGGNRPFKRDYVPKGNAVTQIDDAVMAEATKIFGKQP
jgi:glc operon protein GlcG